MTTLATPHLGSLLESPLAAPGPGTRLLKPSATPEDAPLSFDERVFGVDGARALHDEDSFALTTVSWILFAIVAGGCLLMVGAVLYVI